MRNAVVINKSGTNSELRSDASTIVQNLLERVVALQGSGKTGSVSIVTQMDATSGVSHSAGNIKTHSSIQTRLRPEGFKVGASGNDITDLFAVGSLSDGGKSSQVSGFDIHSSISFNFINKADRSTLDAVGLGAAVKGAKTNQDVIIVYAGAGNVMQINKRVTQANDANMSNFYRSFLAKHSPRSSANSSASHALIDSSARTVFDELSQIIAPLADGMSNAKTYVSAIPSHVKGLTAGVMFAVVFPENATDKEELLLIRNVLSTWMFVDTENLLKLCRQTIADEVKLTEV